MLFKIEKKGGLPTAATLSIILKTGFGIKEESPAWKEFWALWTNERMGESTGSFRPQELVNKLETQKISNHAKGDAVIAAIAKLSQADFNQLELALRRPAVLAGLAALNASYDAGKRSKRTP